MLIFMPEHSSDKMREMLVETLGAFTGVYLSLLIFMKSKEHADQQNRIYLEAVQKHAHNQISAFMASTDLQIEEWRRNTQRQIDAILEASQIQVKALRQQKGDTSYERAAHRRQLNYEILGLEEELRNAKKEMERVKGWIFLRSPEERREQIAAQEKFIQMINDKLNICKTDLELLNREDGF